MYSSYQFVKTEKPQRKMKDGSQQDKRNRRKPDYSEHRKAKRGE